MKLGSQMNLRRKLLDVVTFVLGAILLAKGVFDFDYTRVALVGDTSNRVAVAVAYYYREGTTTLIAVGVALIVLGFVIRSWVRGNE
jgi:hypothetical protein